MQLIIDNIHSKIYTIRGVQVMLDRDLAELYQVENRVLNQAVKRNIERFPLEFMFQLTKEEFENWKSQIVISNSDKMGLRKMPYLFTEQGVSMLSAVLKSDTAIQTSIKIINSFVQMRKFFLDNASIFQRFDRIEQQLLLHNNNFDTIFKAIESKQLQPAQGIFYDGQIYDAYVFANDLLRGAKDEIILIDNYINDTVFTLFSKVPTIQVTIYTQIISKQLQLDFQKYSKQYSNITLKTFQNSHDRFLILDSKEIFHIGASLKDLGKKWFAFSKIDLEVERLIERLR